MISCQVENFSEVVDELSDIVHRHYKETFHDPIRVPCNPNYDQYLGLDELGNLQTITLRDSSKLVGYHISLLIYHTHSKNTKVAIVDNYYIAPEYRNQGAGKLLFSEAENRLKSLGVKEIYTSTKLKKGLDCGSLLESLEYIPIERNYVKYIGDAS